MTVTSRSLYSPTALNPARKSAAPPNGSTSQIDSLQPLQRGWPGEAAAAAAPALPGAAAAQVIHALRRLHPSAWLVAVTADLRELEQLHTDLLTLAPDEQTEPPLVLPPPATTEKQTDLELEGERLAVARRLATGQQESDAPAPLLLTTATALLAPMAEPAALAASGDRLQVGSSAGGSFESLVSKLVGQGYQAPNGRKGTRVGRSARYRHRCHAARVSTSSAMN